MSCITHVSIVSPLLHTFTFKSGNSEVIERYNSDWLVVASFNCQEVALADLYHPD